MSATQQDTAVHKVKIQQTYLVKDTTEEKMLEQGAICAGKVVEQVDYYDTDLYDLAVNETWLSKTGNKWQLIIGKGGQETPGAATKQSHNSQNKILKTGRQETRKVNSTDTKTGNGPTTPNSTRKTQPQAPGADLNGNTDLADGERSALTCYALVGEKEIIAHLSRILPMARKTDNMAIGDVLQVAGIQRYASVSNSTQETYILRDSYTVQVKVDGTSAKKSAVISLHVEIENVTQGFQRLEQLANELDLQLQSV
ncbi:uncharacterized protein LOC134947411 [Pseudophryne corroboree]|uniref:uncharacterized protein LOC134947411 n=1 Tax=Pseudophryne corroboree TaxID=495146 RepID=UPI003081E896